MDIELKVLLRKAIEKWNDQISDNDKRMNIYFTDELINNMTNAAEVVYDQNEETQTWLKEQGYFKD
jgi:hypothetical protein